jgi:Tol biopolymer transport system component
LAGDTIPAFSPDGKLIAFSRNWTSGGSDVFVMPPSGGEPRRITSDAHQLRGITFTADGQDIIYSSARQGGQRRSLWRVPLNGGIPVRLPFGSDYADNPQVAQQGNRFAFVQGHDSEQVWLYDIPVQGEVLQDPKILIGSRQMQVGARYSPDGERIVFTSDRTGSWEIWTSKADGSHPVQLTSFGERQTGTPRWSPDGKWIVFDSRPDKHSEIFVIDSEGGQPRQVTYSGGHDSVVPSFSRDGKWIYYSSNANGNWDLWRVPFDGKQAPVQLTHDQGFSGFESVDGKTIYYCKWDKPGIYSMPVNGGGESLVTIELLPRLWGAWAVAQKGIYLLIPAEKLDTKELYPELAFFDFEQKKMIHLRPTNGVPHPGPILSISPDEKKMLLSQPDVGGSDIMIVENFR